MIDTIIKKCAEMPGISMKSGELHTDLILNIPEGNGHITFFPLFPGLTISYIFVQAPIWPAPNSSSGNTEEKGPLLLNYCIRGRCEMVLNNDNYVYVTDGNLSLTERFAQEQYVYPGRFYEGIEFYVDKTRFSAQSHWIEQEFGIDFQRLTDRFCPSGSTYIISGTEEMKDLLNKLWNLYPLPEALSVPQIKIYTLALFSLLQNLENIPQSQICTFFTMTQVNIAKQIEKIISSDLRSHHPAHELAAQFAVSETSMKNYFRGVFGQNISVYLREIRMKQAAARLASTRLSVAEIAEEVGYTNQSKFAAVFKKQYKMSPLEYRRSKSLDFPI